MPITPDFAALIDLLNQELNQTEQLAAKGVSLARELLVRFPNNNLLTQYFAHFNAVLFFVETYRRETQNTVKGVVSDVDIQEAGEDLAALLGQVLENKLRVEQFVENLESQV